MVIRPNFLGRILPLTFHCYYTTHPRGRLVASNSVLMVHGKERSANTAPAKMPDDRSYKDNGES
jgi:hypothetical protein